MVQIMTVVLMFIAFVISFFMPKAVWFFVSLIGFILVVILYAVKKNYPFNTNAALSTHANNFAKRYWHYYACPAASRDFSASAATVQFGLIPIVAVGCFNGFWWSIAYGILYWSIMGFVAVMFSPATAILSDPLSAESHEEICSLINTTMESQPTKEATQ